MIEQAIAEAKKHAKMQSLSREANLQAMKNGGGPRLTSGQVVGRLFKKPTKSATKQGEARLMLEDMVRRAERKLAEAERSSHVGVQSAEARAEELAKELFHKPGTMLTEEEIARMVQESGCADIRPKPRCNANLYTRFVRTIDGTCNNLQNPLYGASETAFTRIINGEYEDGVCSLKGGLQARQSFLFPAGAFLAPHPSARSISAAITDRNETAEEMPFTHILMQWGQFLDHDMDLSPELEPMPPCEGCTFTDVCEPIRVNENDELFGEGTLQDGECLEFRRSLPTCDVSPGGFYAAREQLNALTSFIDGSNVYGSNEVIGNAVREFNDGLLREGPPIPIGGGASLPIDNQGIVACLNAVDCFLAGDVRANEQISLTIMHTLWLREHNRIARELQSMNPFWNDEKIFQVARSIVGALIEKITYVDYLPKVMGQSAFDLLIGPFAGYDPRVDPGVPNAFATAAYRYGHSLIRPEFARLGPNFISIGRGSLNLVDAFFNPDQFAASFGTDPIVRGLITELSQRFDSDLNFVLTSQLFADVANNIPGTDLASLNIQRGRDHGLPPFLTWVNFCKKKFPELNVTGEFDRELDLVQFLRLYGSLNDVDLWIGGLAEERRPDAFFGSTFACIFGITFANVRNGDRFWYENPGVFTPSQLAEIQDGTLSRIICDNADNIDDIQEDAFRGDQPRVPCTSLPSVDLEQWREAGCFARIQVNPFDSPMLLQAFSSVASQLTFFTEEILENSQEFRCMAVRCPVSAEGTKVFFATDVGSRVSITPNDQLAPNQNRRDARYCAVWPKEVFDEQIEGIFTSLSDCESSSDVAFTVSSNAKSSMEKLELALQQQDGGDDSETTMEDEDDLEAFLGHDGDKTAVENADTEEKEMVSDQALTAQLEQALKDLAL